MSLDAGMRESRERMIRRAGELRREIGGDIRHSIGVNNLAPNDDAYDSAEMRELRAVERALRSLEAKAAAD